ncbi:MAG: hypothetical protein ACTSR8_01115 [Promethearchaeota archaeon]
MKDSAYKCAICSGNVQQDAEQKYFKCKDCNAVHDPILYKNAEAKRIKGKFKLKWSLMGAIISALYLLWLVYRLFIY